MALWGFGAKSWMGDGVDRTRVDTRQTVMTTGAPAVPKTKTKNEIIPRRIFHKYLGCRRYTTTHDRQRYEQISVPILAEISIAYLRYMRGYLLL